MYCGSPSESPSFGSGIVMNVSSTGDLYMKQEASSYGEIVCSYCHTIIVAAASMEAKPLCHHVE